MDTIATSVRVRFAPSPTGHLHVGSVRVAIFNWLFARHHEGTYLVRIEDTDIERSKKEYIDSQLSSLTWLNLSADEEPLYQSSRIDAHKESAHKLMHDGKAYPCFCEPVAADKKSYDKPYQGVCRDKAYTEEDLTRPHAIRFKVPREEDTITFNDTIRGDITLERSEIDDFIILRRNGSPVYQLVVVLDDIFMRITHVIRGEDHITNTPKQILLYQAFGETIPKYAHLPLILGASGQRLSKRDAAVSVHEYKTQGYLADALFNYLVRLGWSHGDQEIFTKEEMVKHFSLDAVGKKGAIFDLKKLSWLNSVYLRGASVEALVTALTDMPEGYYEKMTSSWEPKQLEELISLYKERATTLLDVAEGIINLATPPTKLDASLISKWSTPQTSSLLSAFSEKLSGLTQLNHDTLYGLAKELCAEFDMKVVQLAQPLRLAITGGIVSPGIFELITLLGVVESRKRIESLIAILT